MLDLAKLKQTLRNLLAEQTLEEVFKELEANLPPDVPKFNTLIQFKARHTEIKNQLANRIITLEQQLHQQNLLQYDVLAFISDLVESDFSLAAAKKANMGGVLYRIPEKMQHQKKTKCIVRVAFDEALLKDTLDTEVDVVIESIKIAKNMEVKIVDEEGDGEYFEITSRSTPEQFLEQDEYTEWVFFVKPLEIGSYPLALIISVIITDENGKDRKKDIVLERTIKVLSEPVPEEAGDHTMRKAGFLFALRDPNGSGDDGGKKQPKKAPKKWLTLILILLALLLLAWLFWPKAELGVFNLDGESDDIAAQELLDFKFARDHNSPEMMIEFLAKYENSEYEEEIRKMILKAAPKTDIDKAVKDFRLVNKVIPADRSKPDSPTSTSRNGGGIDEPTTISGTPTREPSNTQNPSGGIQNPSGTDTDSDGGSDPGSKPDPSGANSGTTAPGGNPNTGTNPTTNPATLPPSAVKWNDKIAAKDDPLAWLPTTMIFVKGGKFKMGCNTKIETTGCVAFAEPSHDVKVADFHISRFEVTQALWKSVMGERKNPSKFNDCDLCPVERVSWNEAQDFIKKLNQKTGLNYRLPTEAEWEYAARQGGKDIRFGDGNNVAKTTNFNFNAEDLPGRRFVEAGEYRKRTVDVFMLTSNKLGLYHMSGNVAEWCEDRWHSDYEGAPSDGSAWLEGTENRRIVRGGGWDTEPYASRTYDRDAKKESTGDDEVGFRLVW